MPFESKAQQRYMHAKLPAIAKRWDKETNFSNLPDKKNSQKKRGSIRNIRRDRG